MCGITGFITYKKMSLDSMEHIGLAMSSKLKHRGPDYGAHWADSANGVVLAHRRLSIRDLSPSGNQPMVSSSGRYIIVFNGEIYNHTNIRNTRLPDVKWNGQSDTETFLETIDSFGLDLALEWVVGMFAFGLYDIKKRLLHLCRDRIGEKPLYYSQNNNGFVFGSELKALRANPKFRFEINKDSIIKQLALSCIPAPNTIYKNVYKLKPGSYLTHDISNRKIIQKIYWDPDKVEIVSRRRLSGIDLPQAVNVLDKLINEAVSLQAQADVPLGSLLSGGIDSSLITSALTRVGKNKIKTFTIGFSEKKYDESSFAKLTSDFLGTEHTCVVLSPQEAISIIEDIPRVYDEPFSDSAQIPQILLSKIVGRHVTVCLSGDGGDELFAGYSRYHQSFKWRKILRRLRFLKPFVRLIPNLFTGPNGISTKMWWTRLDNLLGSNSDAEFYSEWISHLPNGIFPVRKYEKTAFKVQSNDLKDSRSYIESSTRVDLGQYLPDQMLVKVDRASMWSSIEGRIPMLDHRIVEFSLGLPIQHKYSQGHGKVILKELLKLHFPTDFFNRPKSGFSVPISSWLRGPLFQWADSLLSVRKIQNDGYLDDEYIQSIWKQHYTKQYDWSSQLWDVLMFQLWLSEVIE